MVEQQCSPEFDDPETSSHSSTAAAGAGKTRRSNNTGGEGTRHPVYRGVRKRRWGKWVSEIREPRKKTRIWLGSFPIPEMAARAYDVAAHCLKGRKAQLNFPDEIECLPRPISSSARDIQAAAAKAAATVAVSPDGKEDGVTLSDDGVDDFWREIELPELMIDSGQGGGGNNNIISMDYCYNLVNFMCSWSSSSSSSTSCEGSFSSDATWIEGESVQ